MFHTYFVRFYVIIYFAFFLGIISWKGASRFNEGGLGGWKEVVFQMGEASLLSGGAPHGEGIGF